MSDPRDLFDDPDAPPSEQEKADAEELRLALDDVGRSHAHADLARALSAAWEPRALSPEEHRALVTRALSGSLRHRRRSARVLRVSFGTGAALALAASVLLVVWTGRAPSARGSMAPALAVSRSTQPLFDVRFAPRGGETNRIDRIAMARAGDLRDNEFAKWGVR